MSTAPVHYTQHTTALSIRDDQTEFSGKQVAALAQMGLENVPGAQLAVFFHQAARTGLDPFAKQVYMIGRNTKSWNPQTRQESWETKYTIQTGIDGYRLVARRAADARGMVLRYGETLWCGRDGQWTDVWTSDAPPVAAKFTVYRDDCPFTHVSVYREYVQTFYDKKNSIQVPNSMWEKMTSNQLAKTAEAGALRKAFPQDLSGIYVDDEMPDAEPTDMGEANQAPVTVQRVRTTAQPADPEPSTEPVANEPAPADVVDEAPEQVDEQPPAEPDQGENQQESAQEPTPEPVDESQPEPEPMPEPTQDAMLPEPEPNPSAPDAADSTPCNADTRREVGKILTKLYGGDTAAKAEALSAWVDRPLKTSRELTQVEALRFITEGSQA